MDELSLKADQAADSNRERLLHYEKVFSDVDDSMGLPKERWTEVHKAAHREVLGN